MTFQSNTEQAASGLRSPTSERPQHDEHVWGTTASFYKYWNEAPWPVFDHIQAWGEWSDLNAAVNGAWV